MEIDHVVLWVGDPARALEFYIDLLGFEGVRVDEYAKGDASFPSVRISQGTIIDLMDREKLPGVQKFTGGPGNAGGQPINHVCFSMAEDAFAALMTRLSERGVTLSDGGENSFGARGRAVKSVYFNDPDGNVLEARYYAE